MWELIYATSADKDLDRIKAYDLRQIHDAIMNNLCYEPNVQTRNRKPLRTTGASPVDLREVWELRVDKYRVFYRFNADEHVVTILYVRKKPPHFTTEDIL